MKVRTKDFLKEELWLQSTDYRMEDEDDISAYLAPDGMLSPTKSAQVKAVSIFNYYYDSIPILSEGEIKLRDGLDR